MSEQHQRAPAYSPAEQISEEKERDSVLLLLGGERTPMRPRRENILEEVKKQLWLAGPLVCISVLQYLLQMISAMFVGHLGELALSSSAVAYSFASVTGHSFVVGITSALDTLCGQSYGAKQYHMLGIHLQSAMFLSLLICIPISIIWLNAGSILVAIGQEPEISEAAQHYAYFMIPGLFAYGLLQSLLKFLQTQNIVFPMMIASAITTVVHIPICWILVFKSGLGNKGAALANSISFWINVLLLSFHVKFSSSCVRTWTGISKEAVNNIRFFLRLAVPSAIMLCLEMWSYDVIVPLSGLLPNPRLEASAMSICFSLSSMVFTVPSGLGGAVSTRISNELGAERPHVARLAIQTVLLLAVVEGTLVASVFVFMRNKWGYAYSNEVEVAKYVATVIPIAVVSNFLDGLQGILTGIARGCGWQKVVAYVNLGSHYLVGIPATILFAFVLQFGGKGLWLGIMCALLVKVLSLLMFTLYTNWETEAKKATERVSESAMLVDEVLLS